MRISDWSSDVCSSDLQATGEFKFGNVGLDLRAAYANTKREAPYERGFEYVYTSPVDDYVNNLNQSGNATISFSKLEEKLSSGAADLSYTLPFARPVTFSGGYASTAQSRHSMRRRFRFTTAQNGRASCRERVCLYVYISVGDDKFK